MPDHPRGGDDRPPDRSEWCDAQDASQAAKCGGVGARNLGLAVIELLGSDGWAVTRSQSTLDGVSAPGALALRGRRDGPRERL